MIKAIICDERGDNASLRIGTVPRQPMLPGFVRIATKAASIAYVDQLIMTGPAHVSVPLPYIPGAEIAGVVAEVAADVSGVSIGDRVMATLTANYGGLSFECLARAEDVFAIPPGIDFATAAAFPTTYGTAYSALVNRVQLRPGETLLVLGAAGGVGLAAVDVGVQLGAKVVAVASSDEKLALPRARGASLLLNHREQDIRQQVRDFTAGRGADVVYDPVGGELSQRALRCVAEGGKMILIGFAAGKVQEIKANYLLVKTITVFGGSGERLRGSAEVAQSMHTMSGWLDQGRLKPHISHCLPYTEFARAFDALKRGLSTGRIVLLFSA